MNESIDDNESEPESIKSREKECEMCNMGTQHRCRRCKKIVCILVCSVQDPDSENENHRVHKDGDSRCSTDKSFSCSICEELFTTKEELNVHLETPHETYTYVGQTSGSFECPTCEKSFSYSK